MVYALTGVYITYKPTKIRIIEAFTAEHLEPGDIVYEYAYYELGSAEFWCNGRWLREFTEREYQDGGIAEVVERGRYEWWVKVRLRNGKTGWVLMGDEEDQFERGLP